MFIKKLLCLVLALAMLSVSAFAEEDLQAQLDSANARIAELEAAIELYKPFYDAQVVIEYDGGIVLLDNILEEYDYVASLYSSYYGIDLVSYGMDGIIKQQCADSLLRSAVLTLKGEELGLYDSLDAETLAGLTASAEDAYEGYVDTVMSSFTGTATTEEEIHAEAIAYLDSMGYTFDILLENTIKNHVDGLLYDYATADVVATEEEIQITYGTLVSDDQANYSNDYYYNNARNAGTAIYWNPEGYRAVKHVLIQYNDDQLTRYNALTSQLSTLETELKNIATAEEPRTAEEIQADIDATNAELNAIYAELMPAAEEIIEKFNAGTPFAELIETYNEDPGMQSEPTKSLGYAVSATSTTWDPVFQAGAMSIENIGEISEPVFGSYGMHIIYYESDIPAGAVDLETVRETVTELALSEKVATAYEATLEQWVVDVNPIYHYELLG